MTDTTRTLLLAATVACLASPALAGWSYTPGNGYAWNPWMEPSVCGAYEYAHKCNAALSARASRCRCIGTGLGWRLNEYYGPGAQYLAPRSNEP
jgi:hypothetical protein